MKWKIKLYYQNWILQIFPFFSRKPILQILQCLAKIILPVLSDNQNRKLIQSEKLHECKGAFVPVWNQEHTVTEEKGIFVDCNHVPICINIIIWGGRELNFSTYNSQTLKLTQKLWVGHVFDSFLCRILTIYSDVIMGPVGDQLFIRGTILSSNPLTWSVITRAVFLSA